MSKLTEQQIRDTVAASGYRPESAKVVLKRALAGEPTTRTLIFVKFCAQNPEHPFAVEYRASSQAVAATVAAQSWAAKVADLKARGLA